MTTDSWRCESKTTGFDLRPNRCALEVGHDGTHRNRSGRIKWSDDGHETRRPTAMIPDLLAEAEKGGGDG